MYNCEKKIHENVSTYKIFNKCHRGHSGDKCRLVFHLLVPQSRTSLDFIFKWYTWMSKIWNKEMKKNRNSRCSTLTWTPYFREMVPSFLVQVTYYQYISKHNGHKNTFLNSLRFYFNLWGLNHVKNSKFLKQCLFIALFFPF